jgi:hypothetical protein
MNAELMFRRSLYMTVVVGIAASLAVVLLQDWFHNTLLPTLSIVEP